MTVREIKLMKECGRVVRKVIDEVEAFLAPGQKTRELDELAARIIKSEGGKASFLGFRGYPASICTSINQEVVHGIPGDRILKNGDIISIDVGVYKNGYHADAADTFALGDVSPSIKKLIRTTYKARDRGIEAARAGNRLGDIGFAVQECVENAGFSVVRDLVGHGIGKNLHEPPQVPNFGKKNHGMKLVEGLAIAIEPMVNVGSYGVRCLHDGWTIVTDDGSFSAHAEHSVIVSDGVPEVLTV